MLVRLRMFRFTTPSLLAMLILGSAGCGGKGDVSRQEYVEGLGSRDQTDAADTAGDSAASDTDVDATEGDETDDFTYTEALPGLGSACAQGDAGAPRPLRDSGKLVGVAVAGYRLNGAAYAETAAREFNYVTPENEMKWDQIEPSQGSFNFSPADRVVDFAVDNDMVVKGHTLVWHSQLAAWAEALTGEAEVRQAMKDHIEGVIEHYREKYPGRVVAWDVVNEALDSNREQGVFYRDSVFYRYLGQGFIAEAFELARQADPDARLFYNDYGIESLGEKSQATYEMIRDLVESDVPIDGIGFQMHTSALNLGPTYEEFEQNVQRYVDLGISINISEMDVTLCYGFESRTEALLAQRERYNRLTSICLQHDACESISVWGVVDTYSWINEFNPCEDENVTPSPLLFDDEYRFKPAWWGLSDALDGCNEWVQ